MKGIRTTLSTAACLVGLALILTPAPAAADQVVNDDCIIIGSQCIGFDCVNGESFGSDTLRLKENNLRIHFDDTSTSASFPRNDWRIVANDSTNGGLSHLSIDDATAGRTPFRIEAGAPSSSLYVDDGGSIGFGTNAPVVDLHVKSGNTPTLRLEQDGSSGFASQTWDLAGNEANFFVRDATSGSTLPFRIFPGAPSNGLAIEGSTGDIGVGTTSPSDEIHVRRTSGNARMILETTAASQAAVRMINSVREWRFQNTGGGDFTIETIPAGPNGDQLTMDNSGNMTIAGDLVTGGAGNCAPPNPACDGVFDAEVYSVESIDEHAAYMWQNQHLRGVGPTGVGSRSTSLARPPASCTSSRRRTSTSSSCTSGWRSSSGSVARRPPSRKGTGIHQITEIPSGADRPGTAGAPPRDRSVTPARAPRRARAVFSCPGAKGTA